MGEAGGSGPGTKLAPTPGALSALLQDLARAPDLTDGAAWVAVLRPGARIGKLELVRELGRGGFGVVWEARDLELGRLVAFKAVRSGGQAGVRGERLLREAEAAARLQHPNIVTLHDVGRAEQGPYLVLELLRGKTLAALLAEGPLQAAEAVRIAGEIAKGLAHAHAHGVVHRDLKPENVFICDDWQVKVLDFGLAHAFGQRRVDGGTSGYMAPEQAEGAPEDERTDVFALGVVLFEMLTGKRPFPDEKALRGPGAAPTLDVPGEPALGELVSRMLEKRPVARPRDGLEVAEALHSFREERQRAPSSASGPVTTRRRLGLRLVGMVVAGVLLGALAAGGVAWWRYRAQPEPLAGSNERTVVAVADFSNETQDPELDGLSGLLIASLAQSRSLSVLTRTRMLDVLRQLGRGDVQRIDEPLARQVGLRTGGNALLLASVRQLGNQYVVELRALEPARDTYLFAFREQASEKGGLLSLIDRLAERARRELRERSAEVEETRAPVAQLTTPSLEAFRHYFAGQQHWAAYRSDDAIREFQLATAVDPDFALAHVQLAYVSYERGGNPTQVADSARRALAGAARLPPAERAFARAIAADVEGRLDDALRFLDEAIAERPDKDSLYLAGELRYHRDGPGDAAAARDYFARALELDPSFYSVLDGMVSVLSILGRTDELRSWVEQWSLLAPSVPVLIAISRARASLGEPDAAVGAARQALGMAGGEAASTTLADALLHAGRYAEAEAFLRGLTGPSIPRTQRRWAHLQLAAALAYQGRRAGALAVLEAIVPAVEGGRDLPAAHEFKADHLTGDGRAGPVWAEVERIRALGWSGAWQALDLAYLGDSTHAAQLALSLSPGSTRERYYRAVVAWRSGRAAEALHDLRGMAAERRGMASFLRGAVAESLGEDREAVAAFVAFQETFSRTRMWRSWCLPLSRVLLSRALERSGERQRAAAEVARLLTDWARADPDLPLLAEARTACRRLGCSVAAR